jgi:hypothetical protein
VQTLENVNRIFVQNLKSVNWNFAAATSGHVAGPELICSKLAVGAVSESPPKKNNLATKDLNNEQHQSERVGDDPLKTRSDRHLTFIARSGRT